MPTIRGRRPRRLSPEERTSLTHGDFWIPEQEREVYRRALQALNEAGVSYVVAGAYAIYAFMDIDSRSHSASDTLMNFAFRLLLLFLVYSAVAWIFSRRTTSD